MLASHLDSGVGPGFRQDHAQEVGRLRFARRSHAMNAIYSGNLSVVVALGALCLAGSPVSAETAPNSENGRYTLRPTGDGVMRLDTQDRCGFQLQQFRRRLGLLRRARRAHRAGHEIGRLQAENDKLKAQLASREPSPRPAKATTPCRNQTAPSSADNQRKIDNSAAERSGHGSRDVVPATRLEAARSTWPAAAERRLQRRKDLR